MSKFYSMKTVGSIKPTPASNSSRIKMETAVFYPSKKQNSSFSKSIRRKESNSTRKLREKVRCI